MSTKKEMTEKNTEDKIEEVVTDFTAEKEENLLDKLLNVETEVIEYVNLKRFGDFKIKGLDQATFNRLKKQCTYPKKNRRTGQITHETNNEQLNALLVVEACIEPNWRDKRLLDKYNTIDPVDVVQKRLLLGEITSLSEAILEASGFDDGIEEVKN